MARARRSTRAAARGGAGTARSQRAEAERPKASRRASSAAASRRNSQVPAAETEEQAAAASGPQDQPRPETQDALEPQDGGAEPARSSSSRRAAAQGGKSGKGSSRRAAAQGGKGKGKGSSRRAAAQQPSTRSAPAVKRGSRRAEADPRAAIKQKIMMGCIGGLILLVIGGIVAWPGIRRGMMLTELDEAPDLASAKVIADEFLAYVNGKHGYVQGAITAGRGSASARIYLAEQINSPDLLLTIGLDPTTSDDDRATALTSAASLIEAEVESTSYVDQDQLAEWAVQPEREEKHPELAMAAAHLLAARRTENANEVLAGVVNSADQHPAILAAAVANLPKVITSSNVGYALDLLTSANNDAVLDSEHMLRAITTSVRAAHVDRIFALLDHEDARVQAAGARFLSGNGIASAGREQAESIGQRISPYLTAEMRETKPEVFGEALKVVSSLSLTGARDQLLTLLPAVPADSDDAKLLAQILGRNFIRKDDGYEDIANQVLTGLAKALDDGAARATAAAALMQATVRELPGLRTALEACIANGVDAACMDAAHHIAGKLYQRPDVIAKHGRDVASWRDFLAQDRPRFEEYQGIQAWMGEYAEIRVTDGGEKIKKGKVDCDRYTQLLTGWLEDDGNMPLGLTKPMVQSTMGKLKQVQYSLMKATPGL